MNKLTRPQKEKLRQFCAVSDASEKVGFDALKAADWDLEAAFELHYNHGSGSSAAAGRHAGPSGGVDAAKLEAMYARYRDPHSEANGPILVDGVTQLCEDLQVEPSDVVMLVLSWHMKAETMCEYSKEEFISGLRKLNCDSIDKLKALLPALRKAITDEAKFGQIYNFAFNWSKERGQKSLALDTALGMWQLLFTAHPWPLVDKWCLFVQERHKKAISRDTWSQLLEFRKAIGTDLARYDSEGAWPYLIDEFVDYLKGSTDDAR